MLANVHCRIKTDIFTKGEQRQMPSKQWYGRALAERGRFFVSPREPFGPRVYTRVWRKDDIRGLPWRPPQSETFEFVMVRRIYFEWASLPMQNVSLSSLH